MSEALLQCKEQSLPLICWGVEHWPSQQTQGRGNLAAVNVVTQMISNCRKVDDWRKR